MKHLKTYEGLFTKSKFKYKLGDYVQISTENWEKHHLSPESPPSSIAKIINVDDRSIIDQYADLRSKLKVIKRNILTKDREFPYLAEFVNGETITICDDDILSISNQENFELEKSIKKYNL